MMRKLWVGLCVGVFKTKGVEIDGGVAGYVAMMLLRMELGMATVWPALRMPLG